MGVVIEAFTTLVVASITEIVASTSSTLPLHCQLKAHLWQHTMPMKALLNFLKNLLILDSSFTLVMDRSG